MIKKTTMFLSFLLAAACLGYFSTPAQARNLNDLQVAEKSASHFVLRASSSDSVALRLFYVGSSTEAVITIASGAITGYAPAGTVDTNFGNSGYYQISATSYDTFDELCSAIDDLSDYGCELLGGKGDDDPIILRDQTATTGTNDLKAAGGFEVKFDTGPVLGGTTDQVYQMSVGRTPPTDKRLCLKSCEVDATGTGNLTVYGRPDVFTRADGGLTGAKEMRALKNIYAVADVEQVITSVTEQVESWTDDDPAGFCFALGTHVAVRYDDTSNSNVQVTANDLRCHFEEK